MNLFSIFGFAQSNSDKMRLDEDLNKILPILKINLNGKDTSKTIKLTNNKEPIIDLYIADLLILYGIDHGTYLDIICKDKLDQLKLKQSDLKELAIKNLNDNVIKGEVRMHGDSNFAMLTFDGDNEANLILLNEFWTAIDKQFNGKEYLLAIPSKDVLLIASIDSKTGIEQMKDKINKIMNNGDHTLTRWIFKRKNQNWEPYIQVNE